jgi:cell division protein FtsZ
MIYGNNITIDLDQSEYLRAKIKVIGVGGAGCNAISNMIEGNLQGVEMIAANTDAQALAGNEAKYKLQLGLRTTKGLGAGSDPEIGKKAAEESEQDILDALKDSQMIFVTCGMGGGTGTGAGPVVAKIAKSTGALVVGIVTRPFEYEGEVRNNNALAGIKEMQNNVDAIIEIPNQKIYDIIGEDTDVDEAMLHIDQILINSTRGISDIINLSGKFNVDFADVRTIMKDKGRALMGIGKATGEKRAIEATKAAITSPLLDGISISGATGLLVNITGGTIIRQSEVKTILETIKEQTGNKVNLIHGIVKTGEDTDLLSVTVIATGFAPSQTNTLTFTQSFNGEGFPPISAPPVQNPFVGFQTNGIGIQIPELKTVSETIKPYKATYETHTTPKPVVPINIPSGHELRDFDKPAIFRNNEIELSSENSVTSFPHAEPLAINIVAEKEEIRLDSFNTGFDFMGIKPNNESRTMWDA